MKRSDESLSTYALLALHLYLYEDSRAVLEYLHEEYESSIATYLTKIRRHWFALEPYDERYAEDMTKLKQHVETVFIETSEDINKPDSEEFTRWNCQGITMANINTLHNSIRTDIEAFEALPFIEKYVVQTALRKCRRTPVRWTSSPYIDMLLSRINVVPPYFHATKLTKRERYKNIQQTKQALETKNKASWTIDGGEMLQWAQEILDSFEGKKWNELAAALAIVTGRRLVEIFRNGEFSRIKTGSNTPLASHLLQFTGQAKVNKHLGVKGGMKEEELPYTIPILHVAPQVIKALAYLHILKPMPDDFTNNDINKCICKGCNNFTQHKWGPNINFHKLRAVYASLSYELFAPWTLNSSISLSAWTTKFLGHSISETAKHYADVKIININDTHRNRIDANNKKYIM